MTRAIVHSAIYRGVVRHRRSEPIRHALRMPLCMLYLDLGELGSVFDGRALWSRRRPAVGRWKRSDYFGDAGVPLEEAVRRRVESETGRRPAGPIRMLTHVRQWGYIFNPVSFYYCFDEAGERVESVLSEITNTPWKERHAYVTPRDADRPDGLIRARFGKSFHVSPFMGMQQVYDWTFTPPSPTPGGRLAVHMRTLEDGREVFDATLAMRRVPITNASINGVLVRHPAMTAQVIAKIHLEALRLWLKGAPVHPHPKRAGAAQAEGEAS